MAEMGYIEVPVLLMKTFWNGSVFKDFSVTKLLWEVYCTGIKVGNKLT